MTPGWLQPTAGNLCPARAGLLTCTSGNPACCLHGNWSLLVIREERIGNATACGVSTSVCLCTY
jgi:hypothetical protein